MTYSLVIAWLYPDLMSTYGDRGNIICLRQRCLWRGIGAFVKNITIETKKSDLETADLIFMGGGQDSQRKTAANDFIQNKGPVPKDMIENDIPALFVCAAYQAAGHFYKPYRGNPIPGASILDLHT